ncbi:TonB-linked SusC/RagA family outer membrane protein [Dyadobacter jejuensis]|uniref:TonB-linked SusC/RagA family outer membrane protein n=1 Tax=Dyadobacter jejuensis TaxID=1082580 RepID=A0A316AQE5_9BACT|nr:TonB-dependent receptor [Dyadobacter jejuensis]PWJ59394.1 TonB-linked SusC/RagA family outer membrane protein [Dyadobacter jejuensis]
MKKPVHFHRLLLWTMRITATQLLLALVFLGTTHAHTTRAQSVLSQKLTIQAKGVEIKKVLNLLEEQVDVKFVFSSRIIQSKRKVDAVAVNKPLYEVLDMVLTPLDLSYEVSGKIIIIKRVAGGSNAEPPAKAQDRTLNGVVLDESGTGLPGVSVVLKGTQTGTQTDASGAFQLSMAEAVLDRAVLVFSFVGYKTQEVVLGEKTNLSINMELEDRSLQEIVVIGYGQVKKSDLTGSVASIKSAEINAYPATNLVQSMAGRAAGVYVSQNNGAPGGAISVRVRGTNSIQGSNEPLYVVDGFPYSGNPTLLNNADIESMEVLKDASATAIYGSRGANGVVLITTKRGKSGRVNVDYEGYFGVQSIRKKLDLMDATQYAQFYNEQAINDGLSPHFTQEQIAGFGKGTDWQDLVFQKAPIQNHSISVSGGNERTRFSVAGSNFSQDGIIIGSNYKRNSLRFNLNSDLGKNFKLDLNSVLSRFDTDRKNSSKGNRGSSLISALLSGYPTIPSTNADGSYSNLGEAYAWGSNAIVNPLNFLYQQTDRLKSNKVLANMALSYSPLPGLTIKSMAGIESTDDVTNVYTTNKFVNSKGSASISSARISSLLSENTISYNKEMGKHNLSAVAGFTYQDYTSTGLSASGSGFISNNQESYDIGAAATQGVPSSYYSKWSLLSYLARANYSFNNRVLVTASIRADGSSRYSEGQKYGYFPSAAVAWRLSEEDWIKNIPVISDMKLRVGYGETGNTAISPYQTLNQLSSDQVVFGDALTTYYAPGTRLAGPLRWETTAQTDAGIDISFLNNRFSFTADYYVKNTRDLLNNVALPSSLGFTYTIQNIGKIQNKGFEFSASGKVLEGPFKWDLSGNISFNKNKVVKLYGGNDILGSAINISVVNDNINILREGEALGAFYGYVSDGYDENGYPKYMDYNESGTRDAEDKRIIGNPNPKYIYGINSNMEYKNFELTLFVQGSQGNDIFNLSAVNQTNDYGQALNMPVDVFNDHWTPTNTDAKYPVIKTNSQPQVSDRFIEDGSYLRVKNIQLSYNLPVSSLNLKWLRNAQVYVSAQNLITFTKYSWYDPEINSYGGSNSILQGIDHYVYPVAKTTTFGIRVGL